MSTTEKTIYPVTGMHCAGCASTVEEAVSRVSGVESATVNLAAETVQVQTRTADIPRDAIREALKKAGYDLAEESDSGQKLEEKRERDRKTLETAKRRMVQSWIVTLPLMLWMAAEMLFGHHLTGPLVMEVGMTLGAGWVLLVPGRRTIVNGWKSALNRSPNMDLLITIGTVASLLTGLLALAHLLNLFQVPIHSFAGIAAMIMAFHLTGRYIETRAKGRTSEAILKLLTLEAKEARVIRNGQEETVSIRELRPGDTVRVRPGEKVPADGQVVDGEGSVDESMITGESMPVRKEKSEPVIGGTMNLEGSLLIQITGVGEDSFLNRVIRLVEEAQTTKVPIQAYADRITAIFVPVVLLLALFTGLFWLIFPDVLTPLLEWADGVLPWVSTGMGRWGQAFYAALAVLVIACPCALGLATPVALMVGSGLGAGNGILIRQAEAIQRMNDVTLMVFDKTGTLTVGEPEVTAFEPVRPDLREELLGIFFRLEEGSEHPLSRAITRFARAEASTAVMNAWNRELREFRSHPGMGVSARIDDQVVFAGNRRLLEQHGINPREDDTARAASLEEEGNTVIFLVVDGEVAALTALSDRLKPEAAEAVRELKRRGYKTVMLTGDNHRVAEAIAAEAGIEQVHAGVLPDQKEAHIASLQKNHVVAMIGDGVNDAPALARADVGIAIGTGTDIAIESGSIVLIDGNLHGVVRACDLSRETFRKIRQNLFWAFFYNLVMIPVAVVGLMHPVLAEAAMAFSSVNVIANSRRLPSRLPGFRNSEPDVKSVDKIG